MRDTCQRASRLARAAALGALLLAACARSGLDLADLDPTFDTPDPAAPATMTTPSATTLPSSAGAPAMMPSAMPTSSAEPPDETPPQPPSKGPPSCVPSPEVCNGVDDDCNGDVDEVPAEPCAGGGFRYCVAGTRSSCPKSCEVCVPGSLRICQNSYCSFWGEQECTADGQGFGPCRESKPPPSCASVASKHKNSAELEQCCIDDGYCCLDLHDLDDDGDRHDMIGACQGVSCP